MVPVGRRVDQDQAGEACVHHAPGNGPDVRRGFGFHEDDADIVEQ
jgi:hypothetical protein